MTAVGPVSASDITVVVAARDAGSFLAAALRSALAQVPAPVEVVVCDDGSTDDTVAVAESFGPSVRVVRRATPGGAAAAKNEAIRSARTTWVCLLDADDEFLPGRLAALLGVVAAEPDVLCVSTDATVFSDAGDLHAWYFEGNPWPGRHVTLDTLLDRNAVFSHALLHRERFLALGGFDESLTHASDWEAWIRMLLAGERIVVIHERLSRYRLHPDSLSAQRLAALTSCLSFLEPLLDDERLGPVQHDVVEATCARKRAAIASQTWKRSLVVGAPGRRRMSWSVATSPDQPARRRALGLAGVVAPGLLGRAERSRSRSRYLAAGGEQVRVDGAPSAGARPRILLTLCDVPEPADTGKRIRSRVVLESLAAVGDVDVVVVTPEQVDAVVPDGVRVRSLVGVTAPGGHRVRDAAIGIVTHHPYGVVAPDWSAARSAVSPHGRAYDLAWFGSMAHLEELRDVVRAQHVVVDVDDVESTKVRRAVETSGRSPWSPQNVAHRLDAASWERLEHRLSRTADVVVVCHERDASLLGARDFAVLPNTYPEPADPRGPSADPVLLLIGNYDYAPNVAAARELCLEVLPLVRTEVPDARAVLVGRSGPTVLADLVGLPGVEVVGRVDSVDDALAGARVAVAPIRIAGGTRIKLIEAMAHALPSVATSVGAEGLEVADGVELFVRDDVASYAAACVVLLRDDALARAMGERARATYLARYRPEAGMRVVADIVERLTTAPSD